MSAFTLAPDGKRFLRKSAPKNNLRNEKNVEVVRRLELLLQAFTNIKN